MTHSGLRASNHARSHPYRFKRFTDSSSNDRNGIAPLELALVDLAGRDWLTFLVGDS